MGFDLAKRSGMAAKGREWGSIFRALRARYTLKWSILNEKFFEKHIFSAPQAKKMLFWIRRMIFLSIFINPWFCFRWDSAFFLYLPLRKVGNEKVGNGTGSHQKVGNSRHSRPFLSGIGNYDRGWRLHSLLESFQKKSGYFQNKNKNIVIVLPFIQAQFVCVSGSTSESQYIPIDLGAEENLKMSIPSWLDPMQCFFTFRETKKIHLTFFSRPSGAILA